MTDSIYDTAQQLGLFLRTGGAKVTAAESCTGGGIAQAITAIPGASAWFDCGFVTYSNEAKQRLLKVPAQLLQAHGAVSREVVCAMAAGAAGAAQAEFAVAVSGIAGPAGGSREKPVGTVWLAWLHPGGMASARHLFSGDRQQVREQAVLVALQELVVLVRQHCTKTH